MVHKHSLKALGRTLKYHNTTLLVSVLLPLSGDFKTLPIIPRVTYANEINACLKQSCLWRNVIISKLCLTTNIRGSASKRSIGISAFSEKFLNIANGKIQLHENTQCIRHPDNFVNILATKDAFIENIFPDLQVNYTNHA